MVSISNTKQKSMKINTFITPLILTLLLSGCVLGYVPPVQQGNVVLPKQVTQLHKGMSRTEVLKILGNPVLINTFSSTKWNYVYTFRAKRRPLEVKHLIISFRNGQVTSIRKDNNVKVPPAPALRDTRRGWWRLL